MKERTKKRYKRYYKNFKEVKKYILLRLLSVFGLSLVFSAGYTMLEKTVTQKPAIFLLFVFGFLIVDFIFMRKVYYTVAHRRKYIMVEGIPHIIYAVVSIAVARILPHSGIYEVMFSVTDIFEFAVYNFTPFVSAVIFNVVLLLAVRFVPLTMKWVYISHG